MEGRLKIIKIVHQNPQTHSELWHLRSNIPVQASHCAFSPCLHFSASAGPRDPGRGKPKWAAISPQTEEINLWFPHTWNHISLCRCIVKPELFDFRFWLLNMSKATWRIYGQFVKVYIAPLYLHWTSQTGSVYNICRRQSQLNCNNMDNLAEVYGERWGKEHWSWAMTQTWQ